MSNSQLKYGTIKQYTGVVSDIMKTKPYFIGLQIFWTALHDFRDFHWLDHIVFFGSILAITVVGVLIAIFLKRKEEKEAGGAVEVDNPLEEPLLGSRRMAFVPVGLSLVGSYVSGMVVLSCVSAINYYGTQTMLQVFCIVLSSLAAAYLFLPVFHTLQVTSSFEYLEMRFASILRYILAIVFVVGQLAFLSLLVHIPAFELGRITGLRIELISFVMSALIVIYVFIGGMRAVIYTAACLVVFMIFAIALITLLGTIQIGGPQVAFKAAQDGGRLIFFNINPAPTETFTVWTVLFGGFVHWIHIFAALQIAVQQYMSVATLKRARLAILVFTIAMALFFLLICYCGILVYEKVHACDPLGSGAIRSSHRLLLHYVMEAHGKLHGIPGLLVAALFAGVLSSTSIVIICTTLVIIEDICKGMFTMKLSESRQVIAYRLTVVVLGFASFINVLEFSLIDEFWAIIASVSFGIFTLGMLVPWANTFGTAIGGICGVLIAAVVEIGTSVYTSHGLIGIDDSDVSPLFRLSFLVRPAIGSLATIIIGTIASFIRGKTDLKKLDARLISPILHRFLPEESFNIRSS